MCGEAESAWLVGLFIFKGGLIKHKGHGFGGKSRSSGGCSGAADKSLMRKLWWRLLEHGRVNVGSGSGTLRKGRPWTMAVLYKKSQRDNCFERDIGVCGNAKIA
jgi:hypothetical protein